jgi:hypothetical protein
VSDLVEGVDGNMMVSEKGGDMVVSSTVFSDTVDQDDIRNRLIVRKNPFRIDILPVKFAVCFMDDSHFMPPGYF